MATTTSPPKTASTNSLKVLLVRKAALIRWAAIGLILVGLLLLMRLLPTERAFQFVQGGVGRLGIWGPVALGLVYVAAALLFVPGWILTVTAGAIYGLLAGTVIVSLASTTAAALAFLIARYLARDRVRTQIESSPKLTAVDGAIGEQGWKIVALLRLSPAVPFNLQNYLYGVTAIRFWPCVLASWLAMLPGTFLYVYLGSIGRTAARGGATSAWEWLLRGVGLLATIAVTVYLTWLARKAIRERTRIDETGRADDRGPRPASDAESAAAARWPWGTLATAALALAVLAFCSWAYAQQKVVQRSLGRLLGAPPTVASKEAYKARPGGPAFDHSTFDGLLREHVDSGGWIDYEGLRRDADVLDRYVGQLARAPFEQLARDEKLALLINAYNAFTLRLILDHFPVKSIKDIPSRQRWDARRWRIGPHTWSLNQIEHEQIRPKFREPRIHFALVCAAVGCPPLRTDAYTADRLEQQLAEQTESVHTHPRWFRFDAERHVVHLTELYDWYGTDFQQYAPTVLDYAARLVPELKKALDSGRRPQIRWIKYDWRLNSVENKPRPRG